MFNNIELDSFIGSETQVEQDLFNDKSTHQSIDDDANVVKTSNSASPSINFEDICSLFTNPTVKMIFDSDGNELNIDSPIILSSINCSFSIFSNQGIYYVAQEIERLIENLSGYEAKGQPDPLQLAFMNIGSDTVIDQSIYETFEFSRQVDKYISNSIGTINEAILALIQGAYRLKMNSSSLDVHICDQNGDVVAIVEVKNRYNTMNSGGQIKVYQDMTELVANKNSTLFDRTAILAVRIPKAKGIRPFAPSNNRSGKRLPQDHRIIEMDFDTLMTRYTGDHCAYLRSYLLILFILASFKVIPEDTDISYYLKTFVKSQEI